MNIPDNSSDQKILKVKGLKKSFKTKPFKPSKTVLHNISFELTQGAMTGFLGINGSGKTTTIKSILDLIKPEQGEVLYFDNQKLSNRVKSQISYLPEKPQLYDHLTGGEFLSFALKLSGSTTKEASKKIDETLSLVDLSAAKNKKLREYSKGMYQRMGLAQAIIRDPKLMILDEPMSDLDPSGRALVKDILKRIQTEKKVSIFISSHLLQDIESLCQEIVILSQGEVKYSGPTLSFVNKLNPKFEIIYAKDANHFQSVITDSEENLQQEIDHLRKTNAKILMIQNQKSLEEAFKNFIEGF